MQPSKFLKLLAVPGTDEALSLVVSGYADDEPYNGWVEDAEGRVWGRLDAFRFRFVKFDPVAGAERQQLIDEGPNDIRVPASAYTSALDERCKWVGNTIEVEGYLKGFDGAGSGEAMAFGSDASSIELLLHAHGWSGIARIEVNGIDQQNIDLFNRENAIVKRIKFSNPDRLKLEIRVVPNGRASESQGSQILVDGLIEYFDEFVVPKYNKTSERNRGGAFRHRFFEIADRLAADAVILDVGGGRRQLDDERYINLEYSSFEEPDIFGDATMLPFRNSCIDFVYTAAVLEHVRDPLKMGREIHRVMKPGCTVLANSAFMQPVHSEGQHFFNLTPYGIDLTFELFKDRNVWWETDFASTIRWFVDVAQIRKTTTGEKVDNFIALADEFSSKIPDERGMYLASGVWLEGIK